MAMRLWLRPAAVGGCVLQRVAAVDAQVGGCTDETGEHREVGCHWPDHREGVVQMR